MEEKRLSELRDDINAFLDAHADYYVVQIASSRSSIEVESPGGYIASDSGPAISLYLDLHREDKTHRIWTRASEVISRFGTAASRLADSLPRAMHRLLDD